MQLRFFLPLCASGALELNAQQVLHHKVGVMMCVAFCRHGEDVPKTGERFLHRATQGRRKVNDAWVNNAWVMRIQIDHLRSTSIIRDPHSSSEIHFDHLSIIRDPRRSSIIRDPPGSSEIQADHPRSPMRSTWIIRDPREIHVDHPRSR